MKKNRLVIAVLIILLFIPTYIGIANYMHLSKTPVSAGSATGIVIKDIAGKTYEAEANSDIAKFFTRINANAIKVDGLPEGLMGAENYVVSFVDGKRSTDTRYYFSKNTSAVYYLDSTGAAYMVKEEDAAEFLEMGYAQSLYENAYLPMLTNGDLTLAPTEYEWAYQTVSGEKNISSTLAEVVKADTEYTGNNGLNFAFSREPATFKVVVKNPSGATLYDGDYSGLGGKIDTKENPVLDIDISASWLGSEENMSGGNASYSFVLNIEAQPEFILGLGGEGSEDYAKFVPGDIAFITAYGISEPDKISFSSAPQLTYGDKEITPVFFADGKNSYALLPTAYDTASGEYKLSFVYNGVDYPLTLTIEAKKFGTGRDFTVSKARVSASRTDATLEAFEAVVSKVISEGDFTVRHFDETCFKDADNAYESKKNSIRGYGVKRTISSTREVYVNEGIDYTMGASDKINAVMSGEVIYVGSTAYSGTMIAIDHGYGLISWYHNIDGATVKVGDTVKKGDIIANKVGDVGFTDGKTLHFRLTVFDVPVCAYDLLWGETGIIFK